MRKSSFAYSRETEQASKCSLFIDGFDAMYSNYPVFTDLSIFANFDFPWNPEGVPQASQK